MKSTLKHILAALLCACLASACATSGPRAGRSAPDLKPAATIQLTDVTSNWDSMADVSKALKGKPVSIEGTTVDLKDCQLVGTKLKHYADVQDERNQPLHIRIPGFVLKNGSTRDMPGGILFRGKGLTFSDLIFLGSQSEDVLSNVKDVSPDAVVKNCRAYGATGKSFQFNDAEGLTFTDNYVTGGITGVRLQESSSKAKSPATRLLQGNTFEDVDTAWNLSGRIRAKASGNSYSKVKIRVKANDGASLSE